MRPNKQYTAPARKRRRQWHWSVGTGMLCLQHGIIMSAEQPTAQLIIASNQLCLHVAAELGDKYSPVAMAIGPRPVCRCGKEAA